MKTDNNGFVCAGPRRSRCFVAFTEEEHDALAANLLGVKGVADMDSLERLMRRMESSYEQAEIGAFRRHGSPARGSYEPDVPFARFSVHVRGLHDSEEMSFSELLNDVACDDAVRAWLATYPKVGEGLVSGQTAIRRTA